MVLHHKLGSIVLTLVTLVGAGVVSDIENKVAGQVKKGLAAEDAKQVEILRDHIAFLWVAGGAVLGSYVGVAIRTVTGLAAMSKYFAVSLCSSLAATPYCLKRWFDASPEVCFFGGFLMAVAAWLVWEVLLIIAARTKDAATRRGWIGVKDELLGKDQPEEKPKS